MELVVVRVAFVVYVSRAIKCILHSIYGANDVTTFNKWSMYFSHLNSIAVARQFCNSNNRFSNCANCQSTKITICQTFIPCCLVCWIFEFNAIIAHNIHLTYVILWNFSYAEIVIHLVFNHQFSALQMPNNTEVFQ